MTDEQKEFWLKKVEEAYPEFRWFIDEYFPELTQRIEYLINDTRVPLYYRFQELNSHLTKIWFGLPDNKFNVMQMPKGWSAFLRILERDFPELSETQEVQS